MKTTRRAASKNLMTAASWDAVWMGFRAAQKSGKPEELSAAKGTLRAWYEQAGQVPPDWTW